MISAPPSEVSCDDVRPCMSAGPGLVYDEATGQFAADLSGDAGNNMVIGDDGGLFVPSTGGATVAVADGDCIALTGDGSAAAPLTASPVLDPDAGNLLVCGPDGLLVSGGAGVQTACGLVGDGSAEEPVAASVLPWGYACDVTANAGRVFCDANGNLRSEPRGRVLYVGAFDNQGYPSALVPAADSVVALSRTLNIANPDVCREATVLVNADVDIEFTLPPNSGASYGIGTDSMAYLPNTGTVTGTNVHVQVAKTWRVTVPAGETVGEVLDVTMGRGTGGARYSRIQWSIRGFVFIL